MLVVNFVDFNVPPVNIHAVRGIGEALGLLPRVFRG
jgi:hypothetical protein